MKKVLDGLGLNKAEKLVKEAVNGVDREWRNMVARRAITNHLGRPFEKFPPEYREAIRRFAPRLMGTLKEA